MGLNCSETQDAMIENCNRISCNSFKNCDKIKCNSFKNCKWYNVPCHIARAVCVLAALVAVVACYVARVACVVAAEVARLACIVTATAVRIACEALDLVLVVINLVLDLVGFIVELIFSIPIIGALLKEVWNVITDIVWRVVGIIDAIGWVIGIRPEKKLRICTIILRDKKDQVANTAMVVEEINRMIDIYKREANIRLIHTTSLKQTSSYSDKNHANSSWVHVMEEISDDDILDVHCGISAVGEDYLLSGSKFNYLMATQCFFGSGRRLLGYGAPITVFVVRSINGSSTTGCSIIFLSNYVTVVGTETVDKSTIAHECGHACLLSDRSNPPETNLMWSTDNNDRNKMTNWQALVVRNSKHVTYF